MRTGAAVAALAVALFVASAASADTGVGPGGGTPGTASNFRSWATTRSSTAG